MTTDNDKVIRQYLTEIARKGGKARAKKYDKKTLSKWGKKGGRPKGSGDKEK
jgi:general stress protein YciG